MQQHYPVIPWIGGKGRLVDWIMARIPQHTCYVEAFCGAAALYFAKPPSEVEVLNDINNELVNMYRVIKCHPEEFIRQFKWIITSRQQYEWEQAKVPDTLTDIQRAARFYYLQKLAFGGRVDGQSFGTATTSPPRFNIFRIEEDLSQAHARLFNTYVENQTWHEVVRRYDRPHTLCYLDPPYWKTEGYGVEWTFNNYKLMAQLAREIQGMMIISVNDIPEMREVFEGLNMDSKTIRYTVGGGSGSEAQELLVWNENAEKAKKIAGSTGDMFGYS